MKHTFIYFSRDGRIWSDHRSADIFSGVPEPRPSYAHASELVLQVTPEGEVIILKDRRLNAQPLTGVAAEKAAKVRALGEQFLTQIRSGKP